MDVSMLEKDALMALLDKLRALAASEGRDLEDPDAEGIEGEEPSEMDGISEADLLGEGAMEEGMEEGMEESPLFADQNMEPMRPRAAASLGAAPSPFEKMKKGRK